MNESTELAQFNELPAIAANAPAVLAKNTNYVNRGVKKGQGLLDTIESMGGGAQMDPDLDAACNEYLLEVKKAIDIMNTGSEPITKMLTAIHKEFTSLRNTIDWKKDGTVPFKIQEARNELARAVAAEQRRQEQALLNKQRADKEKIDILAAVELKVRTRFNEILFTGKKMFNDVFNGMTLDNVSDVTDRINKIPDIYHQSKFNEINEINAGVTAVYIPATELASIIYDARASLYPECSKAFTEEMTALRLGLLDMIPARVAELKEIAKAGKKEQERLQKEAELRQRQADIDLEAENQRKANEALMAEQQTKEIGTAQLSFEKDVAQADIFSSGTQAVKHAYILHVRSSTGYMMVTNLWFKHFAKSMPLDKFDKKTFGSMKADLENLAFNGGEMLAPSQHYEYVEDVKAITKRA